jgi:HPt (histidine-containing phosphotransfer) domain-containing protein
MKQDSKLDLTYLKSISGGDDLFIIQMLDMSLISIPDEAQKLVTFFNQQDYLMMGKSAHKMKASVQMIGEQALAVLVIKIEQTVKTGVGVDDLGDAIAELKVYLADVILKIEAAKRELMAQKSPK